jgi:hypothetical protein
VFFNSSNNETWTPIQKEDMMFEIYSTNFELTKTVEFEPRNVTDITDIMIMTEAEVSEGNSIDYTIELSNTNPVEILEVDAHRQYRIGHNYTGPVKVVANMKSNGIYSPVINPDIQIAAGNTSLTSDYTSVAFDFDSNDAKIVCYVNVLKEVGSDYSIQAQVKQSGVWNWVDMVVIDGKEIGDNWREEKLELDLASNVPDVDQDITRVRVHLNTINASNKVFIGDLRLNNLSQ